MYVISTAALASIAEGESLGDIILNQAAYRFPSVIAGATAVAITPLRQRDSSRSSSTR